VAVKDDPFPKTLSRDDVTGVRYISPRQAYREDPDYLAFIASLECWARDCGTPCLGDVVAHHSPTKGSGRWDDRKTVPLCAAQHHTEIHQRGCLGRWDIAETDAQIHRAQIHHLCNYLDGQ